MMLKQIIIFFLLISFATFSQNYDVVDSKVANYPRFSKVENLASKIDQDFQKDIDKARAAFYWLTKNIRYNLREYYNPNKKTSYRFKYSSEADRLQKIQAIKDKFVNEAFRTKMGVCEEYAQSFKKLCDLLGIEAAVIKGYARNEAREIGNVPNRTNHAWNAVKINDKWLIIDATWAAGAERNGKWIRKFNGYFFDMPKDKIFKTHFPDDSLWVLRFGRMSIQEFYNQPIYTNSFLGLKAELTAPLTGVLRPKSNQDIILKFKKLDTNSLIYYTLKGEKYAKKPVIKTKGDLSQVFIKNPQNNTDLIVYINNNDALHFKVRVR